MSLSSIYSISEGYSTFVDAFLNAYQRAKSREVKPSFVPYYTREVELKCRQCAAPNENYTINCEYCNSPLRVV